MLSRVQAEAPAYYDFVKMGGIAELNSKILILSIRTKLMPVVYIS